MSASVSSGALAVSAGSGVEAAASQDLLARDAPYGARLERSQDPTKLLYKTCALIAHAYRRDLGGIDPIYTETVLNKLTEKPMGTVRKVMKSLTSTPASLAETTEDAFIPGLINPLETNIDAMLRNLPVNISGARSEDAAASLQTPASLLRSVSTIAGSFLKEVNLRGSEGKKTQQAASSKIGSKKQTATEDSTSHLSALIYWVVGQTMKIMLSQEPNSRKSVALHLIGEVINAFLSNKELVEPKIGFFEGVGFGARSIGDREMLALIHKELSSLQEKISLLADAIDSEGLARKQELRTQLINNGMALLDRLNTIVMELVYMDCPERFSLEDSHEFAKRCGFGSSTISIEAKFFSFLSMPESTLKYYYAFVMTRGRWDQWRAIMERHSNNQAIAFEEFKTATLYGDEFFSRELEAFALFERVNHCTVLRKMKDFLELNSEEVLERGQEDRLKKLSIDLQSTLSNYRFSLGEEDWLSNHAVDDSKLLNYARPFALIHPERGDFFTFPRLEDISRELAIKEITAESRAVESRSLSIREDLIVQRQIESLGLASALFFKEGAEGTEGDARRKYRHALMNLLILRDQLVLHFSRSLSFSNVYQSIGEFLGGTIAFLSEAASLRFIADSADSLMSVVSEIHKIHKSVRTNSLAKKGIYGETIRYYESKSSANLAGFKRKILEFRRDVLALKELENISDFEKAAGKAISNLRKAKDSLDLACLANKQAVIPMGGLEFLEGVHGELRQLNDEMKGRSERRAEEARVAIAGVFGSSGERAALASYEDQEVYKVGPGRKVEALDLKGLGAAKRALRELGLVWRSLGIGDEKILPVLLAGNGSLDALRAELSAESAAIEGLSLSGEALVHWHQSSGHTAFRPQGVIADDSASRHPADFVADEAGSPDPVFVTTAPHHVEEVDSMSAAGVPPRFPGEVAAIGGTYVARRGPPLVLMQAHDAGNQRAAYASPTFPEPSGAGGPAFDKGGYY